MALSVIGADARFPHGSGTTTSFTSAWQDLKMGAGGFLSSIWNYSDGTMIIRTDTYGGYLYVPSGSCSYGNGGSTFAAPCWQQVITATSLPSSLVNLNTSGSGNMGLVEFVACPSNTNVAYALFDGTLLVTTNLKSGSPTWVATPQTTTQNANGGSYGPKTEGPFLACDPNNPDIIYVSTASGVFKSINGRSGASASFSQVTAVGTPTAGYGAVFAYDPASSVVSNVTQHFMICTYGTGCYETTNGGPNLTLTSSTPTTFFHVIYDKFSQFWLADGSYTLQKYASSSWSTPTGIASNAQPQSIATDPNSSAIGSNKIVLVRESGDLTISSNNGATWTGPNFNAVYSATTPQPVWLGVADQIGGGSPSIDASNAVFDSSSNLWVSGGISVWSTPAPITASSTPMAANAVGIEQLVTNQIISPPGNSPLAAVWDRGFFLLKNPDVFPSTQYNNNTSLDTSGQIQGGWSLDYAPGTTNFLTGFVSDNFGATFLPASSTDGGVTWTQWPTKPTTSGPGGAIAASTTSNWVVVPGQSAAIQYTLNGGTSWAASSVSTCSTTPLNSVADNRQPLAADRVTANKFYFVDRSANFCVSTNSGQTFTSTGATSASVDGSPYRDILSAVPGQAGNLFWSSGGGQTGSHPFNTHLWKSTNSGVAWTSVNANLKEVIAFGFGAPLPGGSGYPMIYVAGWLSGTLGYYKSADGGATWGAISAPSNQLAASLNSVDLVTTLSGDMNVYGRIYTGFVGSGAGYIDTSDACPWVNFSNTNPNASLTGTITLQAQHSGTVPVTSVSFYVDGTLIGTQTTGTGTPTTYAQSWVTGGVATGAHTLQVAASGNGCTATSSSTFANFSIPITTH
jgi:hypothetical protein